MTLMRHYNLKKGNYNYFVETVRYFTNLVYKEVVLFRKVFQKYRPSLITITYKVDTLGLRYSQT